MTSSFDDWSFEPPICEICRKYLYEHWRGRQCLEEIKNDAKEILYDEKNRNNPF